MRDGGGLILPCVVRNHRTLFEDFVGERVNRYEMINRHEMVGYDDYVIDVEADFSQLMKVARQNGGEASSRGPTPSLGAEKKQASDEKNKIKRKWKKFLLSWWKSFKRFDRENDSVLQSDDTRHDMKMGEGVASHSKVTKQSHRSKSGSITELLAPTWGVERKMPYLALSRSPDHSRSKSYGPIYSAT